MRIWTLYHTKIDRNQREDPCDSFSRAHGFQTMMNASLDIYCSFAFWISSHSSNSYQQPERLTVISGPCRIHLHLPELQMIIQALGPNKSMTKGPVGLGDYIREDEHGIGRPAWTRLEDDSLLPPIGFQCPCALRSGSPTGKSTLFGR